MVLPVSCCQTARRSASGRIGVRRLRSQFIIPLPARKIVHDGNGMSLARKVESGRPTTETVASQYGDLHNSSPRSMAKPAPTRLSITIRVPYTPRQVARNANETSFFGAEWQKITVGVIRERWTDWHKRPFRRWPLPCADSRLRPGLADEAPPNPGQLHISRPAGPKVPEISHRR